MPRAKPNEDLVAAFMALPKRDLERLEWHRKEKTGICCKDTFHCWTDGKGGG